MVRCGAHSGRTLLQAASAFDTQTMKILVTKPSDPNVADSSSRYQRHERRKWTTHPLSCPLTVVSGGVGSGGGGGEAWLQGPPRKPPPVDCAFCLIFHPSREAPASTGVVVVATRTMTDAPSVFARLASEWLGDPRYADPYDSHPTYSNGDRYPHPPANAHPPDNRHPHQRSAGQWPCS